MSFKIDNPISAAAMSLIESIPSLSEAELYRHLKEGYEKSGDVWEMIVDIVEGLIQIRGSEDVTDEELKSLDDYGCFGEDDE